VNAAPPPRLDGGAAGRLAVGLGRVNPVRLYPLLLLIVKPVYGLDILDHDDALAQCVQGDVA